MPLTAGQAARHTVRHGGRIAHTLAHLLLLLALFLAAGFGVAAWRLAQGPVALPWLIPRLEAMANRNGGGARLSIGGAALAWEGFRNGAAGSLDVRVDDVRLRDAVGRQVMAVPHAALSLAGGALVRGRLVPRSLAVSGAHLRVLRAADGSVSVDLGDLADLGGPDTAGSNGEGGGFDGGAMLRALAAPPGAAPAPATPWAELRQVRIRDATLVVLDRHLGVTWRVPQAQLELRRGRAGGIDAAATATLALKGVAAALDLHATVAPGARGTEISGRLGPVAPAALAGVLPQAAALRALDAPVTLTGTARLDSGFALAAFTAAADIGAGTLHLGTGSAPILSAHLAAEGSPERLDVPNLSLVTAAAPDRPRTTVTGHALLTRGAAGVAGTIAIDLDRVDFADLPALWPEGVGGRGTRPWIVANITDGIAHDGHVAVTLAAPPDLSDMAVTKVEGGIDADELTVHWLRPVPPIVHGVGRLNFLAVDSVEVLAHSGREELGAAGTITCSGGRAVFTGFNDPDQFADITADLSGPVPAAFALLGNPKIGLLQRSPLQVRDAAGSFAGTIGITHMNLRDDMKLDDLQIASTLKLHAVRLPGIAAGRDLSDGDFDLHADTAGMHMAGTGALAGIPSHLVADMDFRGGPPSQVLQRLALTAAPTEAQRAALGIDLGDVLRGPVPTTVDLAVRRDRHGEARLGADLTGSTVTLAPLGYAKPPGEPARLSARVRLDGNDVAGIDDIAAEGETIRMAGSAAFAGGKPAALSIAHLVLGRPGDPAIDARGTLRLPARPGEPYVANLNGRSLDVSALLKRQESPGAQPPAQARTPQAPPKPGPPYTADIRFERVVLGPDRILAAVVGHAESDGHVLHRLSVAARTQAGQPVTLAITPVRDGRRLDARTDDAGGLLRALDVERNIVGGHLVIGGSYDDSRPSHPLTGSAQITDFRIQRVPLLAKLLEAMTLYGLVDAMGGSGLGFRELVAPFTYEDDKLTLGDSRVFSASLGMTARGRIDLGRQTLDLQGTIVPAYFFNTLLGDLPLVGRVFSPEKGSGVFAATYSAHGPLADPTVNVNPLAALTPGFLRGVFGLFDGKSGPPPEPSRRSTAH